MLLHLPPCRPALRSLAGLALLCCAGLAQAQFVWIAPNGTRHYSDQPPPPDTPAARILKAPGRNLALATGAPGATAMSASAAPVDAAPRPPPASPAPDQPPTKAPATLAEREADYRKRAGERASAEQKTQADARQQANREAECEAARQALRAVESGVKIADIGPDGVKRYLSAAERTLRGARAAANVSACRTAL